MVDNYTGGAHGIFWIEPYTFRITDSERYDFIGLFREGNASAAWITDKILNTIREKPELRALSDFYCIPSFPIVSYGYNKNKK
ncbi:MAG: hypothetical protein PHC91_02620 [Eubacteriales bacterium]|nr:hypothetical protein [Eubacteriales bacterium]